MYEKEGIEWSFIQFPDNADILELLENRRTGIFALCDEQVRFPKATDLTLVSKIYEHCLGHNRFFAGPKEKANNIFVVKHFAGPVAYSSQYFLEKNHDVVRFDMAQIVKNSSNVFIKNLYAFIRVDEAAAIESNSTKAGSDRRGTASNAQSSRRVSITGKISTLSGEFRAQLEDLMLKINGTSPHYVRCLKPNSQNIGDMFEPQLVISQLRCGGVLEAVRVSRAGYPNRYTFEQFINRYDQLGRINAKERRLTKIDKRGGLAGKALKDIAEFLCNAIADICWSSSTFIPCADAAHLTDKMQRAGIQKGNTMIFLRSRTFEFLERELQLLRIKAATIIQSEFRKYSRMTAYRILKVATIHVQSVVRRWIAQRIVQNMREFRAIALLLRCTRGFIARLLVRTLRRGFFRLQAVYRGNSDRKKVSELRRYYVAARCIQCKMRCIIAKRVFKLRRTEARSLQAVIDLYQNIIFSDSIIDC